MGWKRKQTPKTKQPQRASQKKPSTAEQLTFLEHVYELRSRLFWSIAALIVASAVGFQFKDVLVQFIMAPLHGEKLVYLTPGGGFSFIFTLCLYFGALFTIPIVIYHLYRFLQPVMERTPRRLLAALMVLSGVLAATGAAFGYIVAIPAAINFLTGFAGEAVTANLTAESYLGFVMAYMFGLAALFQLPLLIVMSDHIRRFPPGTLLSTQRFVIVGAIIAAAIVTPTPDIINQMIIAGPIVAVYQLGVIAVWLRHRRAAPAVMASEKIEPLVPPFIPEPEVPEAPPSPVLPPVAPPNPVAGQPVFRQKSVDGFIRSPLPLTPTARPLVVTPRRVPRRAIDGLSIV